MSQPAPKMEATASDMLKYPFHSATTTSARAPIKTAYLANPLSAHRAQINALLDEWSIFREAVTLSSYLLTARWSEYFQDRLPIHNHPQAKLLHDYGDMFFSVLSNIHGIRDDAGDEGEMLNGPGCRPLRKIRNSINEDTGWGRQIGNGQHFRTQFYLDLQDEVTLMVRSWTTYIDDVLQDVKDKKASFVELELPGVNQLKLMYDPAVEALEEWKTFLAGWVRYRLRAITEGHEAFARGEKKKWEDEQILTKLWPVG